ncbi:MAG: S41 family peptidase [bacterium]|nr:S41 family peptidase [bacterium]
MKLVVCGVALSCTLAVARSQRLDEIFPLLDLFGSCAAIVQSDYADEVNVTNLIYGALRGMMRSLDPHSEFMEPEATEELKVTTEGQFGGIGIEIGIRDEYLTVIAPLDDTPAAKAGVAPNDRIIRINHESTRDMSLSEAVKRLRGAPGTVVTVAIQRVLGPRREIMEHVLTRAIIKVHSVRDVKILDPTNHIGYVRVTNFDKTTSSELKVALASLATQEMASLILDLRNNGGGLLNEAIAVASLFLEPGQVVVATRGRMPSQNTVARVGEDGAVYRGPLVVLVNGASASASEIVAGALKDHRRAIVLGSRTFGKGSVQTVIPVGNNNCALRLTTAKYYTPSGECIHGTGIFPTVEVMMSPEDELALLERRMRGYDRVDPEKLSERERARYEELKNVRDMQLERAIDVLRALAFLHPPVATNGVGAASASRAAAVPLEESLPAVSTNNPAAR